MWVVTLMDYRSRVTRLVIQHKDGSNPASICQALRLVRESLVRGGVEDSTTITKAVFEADLGILKAEGVAR
jgi:hypothetical protein